jgi:hypothetical protein
MLVAANQPQSVGLTVRNAAGEPHSADTTPTAMSSLNGGAAVSCTVASTSTVGEYAAAVPAAHLDDLGEVVVSWTWSVGGDGPYKDQTRLMVTTRPVCTLDDLAALPGDRSTEVTSKTPRRRLLAISAATTAIEGVTNRTFSPRRRRERLEPGCRMLVADHPTEILSATQDGEPLDLDGTSVDSVSGALHIPSRSLGQPVEVDFIHGSPWPPEDAVRAVAILAQSMVLDGPWDDRGFAVGDDAGTVRLLTAGVGRTMFSIPEVQAFVSRTRVPVIA